MLTLILSFVWQVDVQPEEDEFQSVMTASLSVLILGVETRLDVPLQQMIRMPWATMETVRNLLFSCFESQRKVSIKPHCNMEKIGFNLWLPKTCHKWVDLLCSKYIAAQCSTCKEWSTCSYYVKLLCLVFSIDFCFKNLLMNLWDSIISDILWENWKSLPT